MDGTPELMSISAFGRLVGLAPSALRFYDDCRVLPPARVDGVTGYRYYSAGQGPRATLLRDLREAGLALPDVVTVLDGPAAEAREVLERHRGAVRASGRAAEAAIRAVLDGLPGGPDRTEFTLGGAELASAARQVAPAAGADPEHPVLGCVLVEFEEDEVRFVATDRYRLSLRTLRPAGLTGPPGRVLVEAGDLVGLGAWAARSAEVTLTVGPAGAPLTVRARGERREVAAFEGTYPAYREMLDALAALPAPAHRVVVDRAALLAALGACGDVPAVALEPARDLLRVADTELPALCGEAGPLCVGFDPAVLAAAVESGVGPDVLLEIPTTPRPALIRSADQGSFTTLVMPVALPHA
ncbi:MerR family transcriptional regulator [Streptomyces sp. RerS4]|uniref:DNA polymerase III subunit beta family protein n=1 Tax=Streptomyces sp. RerS4 TaxID=2942449 RepID=UPI0024BF93E2|nr:MerR family transcriptional regulator [Streptomyces sp. RerS4]